MTRPDALREKTPGAVALARGHGFGHDASCVPEMHGA